MQLKKSLTISFWSLLISICLGPVASSASAWVNTAQIECIERDVPSYRNTTIQVSNMRLMNTNIIKGVPTQLVHKNFEAWEHCDQKVLNEIQTVTGQHYNYMPAQMQVSTEKILREISGSNLCNEVLYEQVRLMIDFAPAVLPLTSKVWFTSWESKVLQHNISCQ